MTEKERDAIIVQLSLMSGYNESAFKKMTNEELLKELAERLN
jgi:hypothetical protein